MSNARRLSASVSGSRDAIRRSSVMSWNWPTQHSGRPNSSRRKVRLASVQTTSPSGRTKRFSHCQVLSSPRRMRQAASTSLWRSSGCVSSWSRMPISSSAVRPSSAHSAALTRTYSPSVLNSAIPSGIWSNASSSVPGCWRSTSRSRQRNPSSSTRTLTSSANGTPSARRPSSGTSGTSVPAVDALERRPQPGGAGHEIADRRSHGIVLEHLRRRRARREDRRRAASSSTAASGSRARDAGMARPIDRPRSG